jgi:hypothetical protein
MRRVFRQRSRRQEAIGVSSAAGFTFFCPGNGENLFSDSAPPGEIMIGIRRALSCASSEAIITAVK